MLTTGQLMVVLAANTLQGKGCSQKLVHDIQAGATGRGPQHVFHWRQERSFSQAGLLVQSSVVA